MSVADSGSVIDAPAPPRRTKNTRGSYQCCHRGPGKIGYILLRDHVGRCVVDGIQRGESDVYLDELIATVQRFSGR